jgi:hypothetical protein
MSDFFGKIADGFNKGVATVSTGSKNVIEKSKINTFIKNLEDEKKQLIELLGNKVYLYFSENPDADIPKDVISNFCKEIDSRLMQMEEQRAKIAELDAEMNQVRGTTSNAVSKICACGHENSPTAKFCINCGNRFN